MHLVLAISPLTAVVPKAIGLTFIYNNTASFCKFLTSVLVAIPRLMRFGRGVL